MKAGFNLSGFSTKTFLNVFKSSSTWDTMVGGAPSGQENLLVQDFDGYPTTLTGGGLAAGTTVRCVILQENLLFGYRPGPWIVKYTGSGTLGFGGGGRDTPTVLLDSHATGRYEININTPTPAGFYVHILTTDPANRVRNIVVVHEDDEAILTPDNLILDNPAANIFSQDYLDIHAHTPVFRAMDVRGPIYANIEVEFSDRVLPSKRSWTFGWVGAPLEVLLHLANKVGSDLWLCSPMNASDAYMNAEAAFILAHLRGDLKCYSEYANELWLAVKNRQQYGFLSVQMLLAQAAIDGGPDTTDPRGPYTYFGQPQPENQMYGYMHTFFRRTRMADIWNTVWTGPNNARLITVLADQVGGHEGTLHYNWYESPAPSARVAAPFDFTGRMPTPMGNHFKAYANAPYYGTGGVILGKQWTSYPDKGVAKLLEVLDNSDGLPSAVVTTTGTADAFVATWGDGTPPVPGDFIAVTFHTIPNATTATLTVNGVGPYLLSDQVPDNRYPYWGTGSWPFQLVDHYGSGTVTPQWVRTWWKYTSGRPYGPTGATHGTGELQWAFDMTAWAVEWMKNYNLYPHLIMTGYEGGITLTDSNGEHNVPVQDSIYALVRDPRMYDRHLRYYEGMRDAGMEVFCHFNDLARLDPHGVWGELEELGQPGGPSSPRYNAHINFIIGEEGGVLPPSSINEFTAKLR